MNKTKRTGKAVVLPMDACPSCGKQMIRSKDFFSLPVNGEAMSVRVPHFHCQACGESMFSMTEARELRERAFEKYRKKHGLLTAEEIRGIREYLGLSQRGLAKKLHLGEVTISRWESNRIVQTAALDLLLRLIRDVPQVRDFLKKAV